MTRHWKRRMAAGVAALGLAAALVLPAETPVAHMQSSSSNTIIVDNDTEQNVSGVEASPCSRDAECATASRTATVQDNTVAVVFGTAGASTFVASNDGDSTVLQEIRAKARARNTTAKAKNRTEQRIKRVDQSATFRGEQRVIVPTIGG